MNEIKSEKQEEPRVDISSEINKNLKKMASGDWKERKSCLDLFE